MAVFNKTGRIFSIGVFVFSSCFSTAVLAQRPPPPSVVIESAEMRELAPIVMSSGSVISRNEAQVAAEAEARLEWVADVGDAIKKGEALARLDTSLTKLELAEYEAEVGQVAARINFLEKEVARLQSLAKSNNAAQTLLEERTAERDTTRSERAVAEAQLAQVKLRLEHSVVRSPFDGVVVERLLKVGEWVNNGDAVVRLIDPVNVEIDTKVPITYLKFLNEGARLHVSSDAQEGFASIRTVVRIANSASRLLSVRLIPEGNWPVGLPVKVAVPSAETRQVLTVPRDALVLRRSGATVYRISEDNNSEKVDVGLGIASGPYIEVTGDLKAGDRVVTRGGERLRPGQAVNVIELGAKK
jgi:RND family efflux transporter MFP subunit